MGHARTLHVKRHQAIFPLALLALLGTIFVAGCDSSTTMTDEPDPRTGRGATLSVTLLAEKSAAQINSEFASLYAPITARYAVSVYKIVYETIDAEGATTQASGALLVPRGAPGSRPMMSYQHGTMVARNEAPSVGGAEQTIGLYFAADGYVAVLPDLLGLGDSPGLHPYVHAASSATAVVDMLRAATDFVAANGPALNGQLFLTGYSQGGYTAMAAHREIEASYQSEFQVTAAAPMAGPYDLSGVMVETFTGAETHPSPYYLPYTLLAYNEIYDLWDTASDLFVAPYDTALPPLFDGLHSSGQIDAVLPNVPSEILNPAVITGLESDPNYPLLLRLQENDVYDWTPQAPVRLFHCALDRHVPPENSQIVLQHFQARGAQVQFTDPWPIGDHGSCVLPSLLLAKLWFDGMVQ